MIDTVRTHLHGVWRGLAEVPHGWRLHRKETVDELGEALRGVLAEHEATGLRVGGTDEAVRWCEVSMPRLLHASNGQLLRSDADLTAALDRLDELLAQVADVGQRQPLHLTRMDLVSHVAVEPRTVIASHRAATSPHMRSGRSEYAGESVNLYGSALRWRAYDKWREATGEYGQVTRCEWQLRSDSLWRHAKHLMPQSEVRRWEEERGVGRPHLDLRELQIADLWEVYRDLTMTLTPTPQVEVGDEYDVLAVLVADGVVVGGRPLLDVWCGVKSKNTATKWRREVQARVVRRMGVDWSQLLPEQYSPGALGPDVVAVE